MFWVAATASVGGCTQEAPSVEAIETLHAAAGAAGMTGGQTDAPSTPDASLDDEDYEAIAQMYASDEDLVDDENEDDLLAQYGLVEKDLSTDVREVPFYGTDVELGGTRSDTLCILSEMRGNFKSYGRSEVYLGRSGALHDKWLARGSGNAICMKLSLFTGQAQFIGGEASLRRVEDGSGCRPVPSIQPAEAFLWRGDSFSFLTGVRGEFDAFTEKAWIDQATTGIHTSRFSVDSHATVCDYQVTEADARSFFSGTPDLPIPMLFVTRQTGGGFGLTTMGANTAQQTITFEAKSNGTREVEMIPRSRGFCAFTHLAGNFNGTGEKATITSKLTANGDMWVLRTVAGNGSSRAQARCMPWGFRSDGSPVVAPD